MHEVLKKKSPCAVEKVLGPVADKLPMKGTINHLGKFLEQLYTDDYTTALRHCRDRYNQIVVDRFRVKPIVKITGEFWAQTTEGDGNFNMVNFLNQEAAQLIAKPIGPRIMYLIHQHRH